MQSGRGSGREGCSLGGGLEVRGAVWECSHEEKVVLQLNVIKGRSEVDQR